MSNDIPLIYVDIKQTKTLWPLKRPQKWYFVILSALNFKKLAKSETYVNEQDCIDTARLVGSGQTSAYLRRSEHGNELLRLSTLIETVDTTLEFPKPTDTES